MLNETNCINILLSEAQINARVKEMGAQISNHYRNLKKPLLLIGVLKGAIIFLADLCRNIDIPIELEFISVTSYADSSTSSENVQIARDITTSIEDKVVLLVEDIIDSGNTIKYLLSNFAVRNPKNISVCCFLKKSSKNSDSINVDFLGFNIPDLFVFGYGLDWRQTARNLPYVAVYTKNNF